MVHQIKFVSFTPKNVGTTDARPIALFRLDFVIHINMNGTTNVAPVPPNVTINICVPDVIIYLRVLQLEAT